MRTSTVLLIAGLLASVASAAWLWHELDAERAISAELSAKLQLQVAEGQRASAAAVAAAPAPAAATPRAAERIASAPVGAPVEKARVVEGRAEDWRARQRQLMSDPKYREARREQQRLSLAPRRANLIKLYGFTPEQADAAIDLRIDYEQEWQEETSTGFMNPEGQKGSQTRLKALQNKHQDDLRALLGEEKRMRLHEYMESRQSRMQVDSLRAELNDVNALRDDQVEPLIAALHTERSRMQEELQEFNGSLNWEGDTTESSRRIAERQSQLLKSMIARMHSSASGILSGGQLDTLDDMLKRELARFEAQQRMQRIQSKLDQTARPATSPN
jgi:hypothetical protein